jgi:CheY-like chemotaxis protein
VDLPLPCGTLPNLYPRLRLVSSREEDSRKLIKPSGEPLRVMIVEDEAMVATMLTDIVEELGGHVVATITSGLASVGAASGARPDVIVMDVGLPGMDGIDAAAIILARQSMPLIFISGRDIGAEATQRLGGLDGIEILVKPIMQSALCEAIHRAHSRSAAR